MKFSERMEHPVSTRPQTECLDLLPRPTLYSSLQQTLGRKVWATTAWLSFCLRLDQSSVTQGGLELAEIHLPVPPECLERWVPTLPVLSGWLVAICTHWSSGKLYCHGTNKISPQCMNLYIFTLSNDLSHSVSTHYREAGRLFLIISYFLMLSPVTGILNYSFHTFHCGQLSVGRF